MAERVVKLEVPYFDPEPNVPEPVIVQSELECYLIYWEQENARKALVFSRCWITKFGYPNDSALGGHRLYKKGLGFYGVFEVIESEWIAEVRKGNQVCFPDYKSFEGGRHFIFTFHDSTFECIALDFHPIDEFPKLDSKLLRIDESLCNFDQQKYLRARRYSLSARRSETGTLVFSGRS